MRAEEKRHGRHRCSSGSPEPANEQTDLKSTVSSPMRVHVVPKVAAKRAPEIGEHTDEVLEELGFNANDIASLHASGAVPQAKEQAEAS
jgi:hypothetical protein